jgi:RimJ/RimL family protein N-acetyltransferase
MQHDTNHLGQPIGFRVDGWMPPPAPDRSLLQGRLCRLEPLDAARHTEALYEANKLNLDGSMWTYMAYGPFDAFHTYREWVDGACKGADPLFFAIVDLRNDQAVGVASYLRIDPGNGTIEVGHLAYSPLLQRKPAATEAMYLMMAHAFELGYRRYEWKCNALNLPSRAAAQRLGLSYEGVFRQATVVKGRNRDTAWYAATDRDWPSLKIAFQTWLAPANFDTHGKQRVALSALTHPLLMQRG